MDMGYALHHESRYVGNAIQHKHSGKLYHLHSIGYTKSVLLLPRLFGVEDLARTLKSKYPSPRYRVTSGIGSTRIRDWLINHIGRGTWDKVASVWLVWKISPK